MVITILVPLVVGQAVQYRFPRAVQRAQARRPAPPPGLRGFAFPPHGRLPPLSAPISGRD